MMDIARTASTMLALVALALPLGAAGQDAAPQAAPTPENAHRFISTILAGRAIYPARHHDHVSHEDDEIFYIHDMKSSGCGTRLYSSPKNGTATVYYQIDWSKVDSVHHRDRYYWSGGVGVVQIDGGVSDVSPRPYTDNFESVVWIDVATYSMRERVLSALEVLRKSCDRTTGYGF